MLDERGTEEWTGNVREQGNKKPAYDSVLATLNGVSGGDPVQVGVFYRLVAAHSGKLAGIAGVSTAAGAALTQWSATGGLNQQFDFVSSGEGYYRVRARHSGLAMDVWGASSHNGKHVSRRTNAAR